jgi:hypothetical protein
MSRTYCIVFHGTVNEAFRFNAILEQEGYVATLENHTDLVCHHRGEYTIHMDMQPEDERFVVEWAQVSGGHITDVHPADTHHVSDEEDDISITTVGTPDIVDQHRNALDWDEISELLQNWTPEDYLEDHNL